MLADANSIFPRLLSEEWRKRGYDVAVVTAFRNNYTTLPNGTPVLHSDDYESRIFQFIKNRLIRPCLRSLENQAPRYRKRFEQVTGIGADEWQPYFATFSTLLSQSIGLKNAAMSLKPRFVFGHEVTSYGVPTALCNGIPRILFPWGGDIFQYAETSPYMNWIARFALQKADLIVPSSITGARHIVNRFGISEKKVVAISWGVKSSQFQRCVSKKRQEVCAKWRIPPGATLILNARRFLPPWGCYQVLEAFCNLAHHNSNLHFVLLGGEGTKPHTDEAQSRVAKCGLSHRITILQGDTPLKDCAELMSISDVFVSQTGLGDMRSASVLQAASAGGVPVLSPLPEYREMEKNGFQGFYSKSRTAEAIHTALCEALSRRPRWPTIRAENSKYVSRYENWDSQMNSLLTVIENAEHLVHQKA